MFVQDPWCVSAKSQSSCFFSQSSNVLTDNSHPQPYVSYLWSEVYIIPSSIKQRAVSSQPRGLGLPAKQVNSLCISDRQKIVGKEMAWFAVGSLWLALTSLKWGQKTQGFLLEGHLQAKQCFLCFLSALLPFTVFSCPLSVYLFSVLPHFLFNYLGILTCIELWYFTLINTKTPLVCIYLREQMHSFCTLL